MRGNNMQNWILYLIILLTCCAVTMFFCTRAYAENLGYVNGDGVNFRETPNGELIDTYNTGKVVTIISVDGDWTNCEIDGVNGYVWTAFLTNLESVEVTPTPEPTSNYAPTPEGSYYIEPTPTPDPTPTPEPTPEPTPTPTPEPTPELTPEPTQAPVMLMSTEEDPDPTPEPTPLDVVGQELFTDYATQNLMALGTIQGFLVFFTVAVLCYFVYKFLRIFF